MKKYQYLDMVKTLLPEAEFEAFAHSYDQPLKKSIKILKSGQFSFPFIQQQLENDGRTLTPPNFSQNGEPYDDVLFVDKTDKHSLWSHPFHQKGAFYVQEMAAGLPAQILGVQPWDIVLDMCAAPGGKSIQLADRNAGLLIANELNPNRRKALKANLERCGIRNVCITGYDGRKLGDLLYEQCDKVLLDAPCSGEGMQYKSDFKIYHWNEKQVKKLAYLQKELLISGLAALKVWGELVYSTCTTNVIENEGVVASILEEFGESITMMNVEITEKSSGLPLFWSCTGEELSKWKDRVARFRPHIHHTGWFFIAKFKKIKSRSKISHHPKLPEKQPSKIPTNTSLYIPIKNEILANPNIILLQTKHTIRAVGKEATHFLPTLHIYQAGLPVFKVLNTGERKPLEGLEKLPHSQS